ncbi:MAG: biotin--[acetyl-CoA-carboxylase] ligase [Trueperaceae bacterium]|nr:biotin--[acetyl-CoA-carboxylase] ligase [Trueperaceae bacterium]
MTIDLPLRIERHAELGSSQQHMHAKLDAGEPVHGLVVQADVQTQGHGRRGHVWQSSRGGSYQTLAVRDPQPPSLQRSDTMPTLALGIAETFVIYGVSLKIKWPNDLFYQGRKLGGIIADYRREHLLIGVGVNVNNDVPDHATKLAGWDVAGVNMVILEGLQKGLEHLLTPTFDLATAATAFDFLAGRHLELDTPHGVLEGTARGFATDGGLRFETPDRTHVIHQGHVRTWLP